MPSPYIAFASLSYHYPSLTASKKKTHIIITVITIIISTFASSVSQNATFFFLSFFLSSLRNNPGSRTLWFVLTLMAYFMIDDENLLPVKRKECFLVSTVVIKG